MQKAQTTSNKAIAVLGMHRNGTSLVCRGINLMGAWLGRKSDLMAKAPDNPAGFWERNDIMEFHDRVLANLNRTWDTPTPMPERWQGSELLKNELSALISQAFGGKNLWAFKDPRTCLLLSLWKDVLKNTNTALCAVIVVRNPVDVAKSLEKRNKFSRKKSFALWFNHYKSVLETADGLKVVVTHYDQVVDKPEKEFSRICRQLEIPITSVGLKKAVASVDRKLRHSVSGGDDLKSSQAPEPVKKMYQMLEQASRVPQNRI